MTTINGRCLCKAIAFTFRIDEKEFDVCHCSMCRRWGGGPAFAVEAKGSVKFSGEESLALYSSSDWAERGFCKKCGSHLFYRLKDQSFCNFNLGTIEDHEKFKFNCQIFIDAKPENYSFSNKTKNLTEKEVLESSKE